MSNYIPSHGNLPVGLRERDLEPRDLDREREIEDERGDRERKMEAEDNPPESSQTFLHNAELEFRWLLAKLGNDQWAADLRAFQMKRQLADELKRLQYLWRTANAGAEPPRKENHEN
jgi:hypothetical protein